MDTKRYFEILKLDSNASLSEVKQAYRDLVDVWHPDRFSHNPRLQKKAEEELEKINMAYSEACSFLESEERLRFEAKAEGMARREAEAKFHEAKAEAAAHREEKTKAKSESDIDWENRVLCADGRCIGIIDRDGRCTECGKTLKESKEKVESHREDHSDYENEHIDWENRVLCGNGTCIGIIGPDGRCTECGKRLV
jgi:curved DNA-binding protein CbpA